MNKYRLYAMPTKPETIDGMAGQRFSRITTDYSLVYTDGEAPEGSAELTEEHANRLSRGDESWLLGCNIELIREEIERQKPEMLRKIGEQIDRLEEVIKEANRETGEEARDAAQKDERERRG